MKMDNVCYVTSMFFIVASQRDGAKVERMTSSILIIIGLLQIYMQMYDIYPNH